MADQSIIQALQRHDYGSGARRLARVLDCKLVEGGNIRDTSNSQPTAKFLFFLLPHELGLMADGESVNLVCLATMTTKTGWQFLYEKLGIETNEKLDDPNHSLDVNILELFKDLQPQLSTKMIFKIHYCKISHEFGDVLHRPDMIPDSAAGNELLLTRLKEARYMSNKYQRGTGNHEAGTPDCGQFRKCLMFLMLFADFNGILATGYRLLTTEMLMVLFDQGQVHLDFSSFPPERAAESDIRKLVEYCLYPLCLGSGSVHTRRISIIAPTTKRDLAEGVTVDNSRAIRRAIQRPMGPDFHVSKRRLEGESAFLQEFDIYIRASFICWHPKAMAQFKEDIPKLLLAVQNIMWTKSYSRISTVIWPHLHGKVYEVGRRFYGMIGLHTEQTTIFTRKDERPIKLDLPKIAEDFTTIELSDAWLREGNMYDQQSCLVAFDVLTKEETYEAFEIERKAASVDTKEAMPFDWILAEDGSRIGPGKPVQLATVDDLMAYENMTGAGNALAETSTSQPTQQDSDSTSPNPGSRFRDAAQCMNRLMFDPRHYGTHYEVGYEDRFDGLMWKPLDQWQKNSEEEDFIPTHRVQKIRRLGGDQRVVWDRKARYDGT